MPVSADGTEFECEAEGCEAKVKSHAWGFIKAEGWFFSRDGMRGYCPDHLPDWVEGWRRNKRGV